MSAREFLARDLAIALGLDIRDLVEATITLKRDELPKVTAVYYVRHNDRIVAEDGGITTRVAKLRLVPQVDEGATS